MAVMVEETQPEAEAVEGEAAAEAAAAAVGRPAAAAPSLDSQTTARLSMRFPSVGGDLLLLVVLSRRGLRRMRA